MYSFNISIGFSRRVLHSLSVSQEFDLFETRMALQYDVVDAFVIQETNFTKDGRCVPFLFKLSCINVPLHHGYHFDFCFMQTYVFLLF